MTIGISGIKGTAIYDIAILLHPSAYLPQTGAFFGKQSKRVGIEGVREKVRRIFPILQIGYLAAVENPLRTSETLLMSFICI